MAEIDFSKWRSSEIIDNEIKELESADLNNVSYTKLFLHLRDRLEFPIIFSTIPRGTLIERARINEGKNMLFSEKEISYRTDSENIIRFGRANNIFQSLFYGTAVSSKIKTPRITNIFELDEILRNNNSESSDYYLTSGQWEVMEDLTVADICLNDKAIETLPEIKAKRDAFFTELKKDSPERFDDVVKILVFYSNQFAKSNIKSHNDYKISAAFTNIVFSSGMADGVLFPSVRTAMESQNIALTPAIVEIKLKLRAAATFRIINNAGQVFVDNVAETNDFGPMNSAFNWKMIEPTPEDFIRKCVSLS